VNKGDRIIIFAMAQMEADAVPAHRSKVVICNEHNGIDHSLEYPSSLDEQLAFIPQV
jgi:aspartate 1-decarboxylase